MSGSRGTGGIVRLFALVLLGWSGSFHASAQTITEYDIPGGDIAFGVTAGPDGNLWFTEGAAVGRVAPDGDFTIFPLTISPVASISGITSGPDGNLWVVAFDSSIGRVIGRVTTDGQVTSFPLPIRHRALSITSGPDGNLWFTEPAVPRSNYFHSFIGQMTPQGDLTEYELDPRAAPAGIVSGSDGNLWFTEEGRDRIGRMTPEGGLTEFNVPGQPWDDPLGIAAGPDGNLWFTEQSGNTIGRITPDGIVTQFPIPTESSDPSGIASGPDGNLWFTEGGAGKIGRISTTGTIDEFRVPGADAPGSIAAGPDGSIWFVAGNKVGRITAPPSITPTSGPSSGGTAVVVTGAGFAPGALLTIGGVPAINVVVESGTEIDATAPPLPAGTLNDVVAVGPGSTAALPKGWLSDFLDVPQGDLFHQAVETIFRSGVTAGCGGGNYCRDDPVRRDQMAVLLLKAEHGPAFVPGRCVGVFDDVPCTSPFAPWIESFWREGITVGCGGSNYCPNLGATRSQTAVFLLRTTHGRGYDPPLCTGVFADVPCPSGFAVNWIEELYQEGVTGGCSTRPLNYCPDATVTRGQMAAFLTRAFHLQGVP